MVESECLNLLKKIETNLETLSNEMVTIKSDLSLIKEQLNELNGKNEKVYTECSKMSEHIDFINTIYSRVKNPLNCILNTVTFKSDKNNKYLE